MGRDVASQIRLDQEIGVLFKVFGKENIEVKGFTNDTTYISYTAKNKDGIDIRMTIRVPRSYPTAMPTIFAVKPELTLHDGSEIPTYSSIWHTLASETVDGKRAIQICHFHSSKWTEKHTLYLVLQKGVLWCQAYNGHKSSGLPMNKFLHEVKM
eukprot:m.468092 g.468092  ORF g.468092 m.468092 type:complete len:154 (-) comp27175_c0_seq1:155-616(-)